MKQLYRTMGATAFYALSSAGIAGAQILPKPTDFKDSGYCKGQPTWVDIEYDFGLPGINTTLWLKVWINKDQKITEIGITLWVGHIPPDNNPDLESMLKSNKLKERLQGDVYGIMGKEGRKCEPSS